MEKSVKERVFEFIERKNISIRSFEEKCGLSNGYFRQLRNSPTIDKVKMILYAYPEISRDWLVYGEGDMIKSLNESDVPLAHHSESGIPLIPLDAMAGYFEGEMQVLDRDCERYVVPGMQRADFLITVKGDSMMPAYVPGDIVACVRVPLRDVFFQWGRVYVLDTDQGPIIKRICKVDGDDCSVRIESENPKYQPFTLPLSSVRSVALVIGLIRLE